MQLNTVLVMLTANSVTYTIAAIFMLFAVEILSRTLQHSAARLCTETEKNAQQRYPV